MATKVTSTIIDDLDGESDADETVKFSLDGVSFEIDLSAEHAEQLRNHLRPYRDHARRLGGRRATGRLSSEKGDRLDMKAVRAWGTQQGYAMSDRGRIPLGVLEKYKEAVVGS